jgi:metal transporter CNNM
MHLTASGGSVLPLDQIMQLGIVKRPHAEAVALSAGVTHILLDGSPFPLLQQTEHPTTQQVVWSIHPCNVRDAVETILPPGERTPLKWLETWLMLSSTLVDLR